jgi:nucleotide-binding universal stress UspA family protein
MKRILCAIDHSEPSLRGAALAMDLAARYQAELVLLTVLRLPDAAQPDLTDYLRHEHEPDPPGVVVAEAAHDELRSLGDRLTGQGAVAVTCEIRAGNIATEIISSTEQRAVDLIVIGHRGRNRLAQALIGSVARRVVDTAPCPVLIVR